MLELRPYQREAIEAIYDYWAEGGGNPLVDMATGLGKSVVIARLVQSLLEQWPGLRVVMLVHVRELVAQNFQQLIRLWPEAPCGIYSAGLNRRDAHSQIVFASIQSIYKRAHLLGPRDLIVIDEAHLVPHDGEGMYQRLLNDLRRETPDLRVCGFTATPYRLDSGRLDRGDNRLFDRVVYSYGVGAGIEDGYLSPLVARASAVEIDVSDVQRRGGEFVAGALEEAANKDDVIRAAVAEMQRHGADRRSWLVFCSGVKHAVAVRDVLREQGISAETVTGETPSGERDQLITDFKAGRIRALTNAQVLTTGFDAPGVDLVAFLRPTLSTGLYVQMIGRGTRKASGKENCLVLDFAGNVRRHGPVDAVAVKDKKQGGGAEDQIKAHVDDVRAKECPQCGVLLSVRATSCWHCGHEFPIPPKHEAKPDIDAVLLSRDIPRGPAGSIAAPVYSWRAGAHYRAGDDEAPPTVRVTYRAGLSSYDEWICPEHDGFARTKFESFWKAHGGQAPIPTSVQETLFRWSELTLPAEIFVSQDGKWWRVVARKHGEAVAA